MLVQCWPTCRPASCKYYHLTVVFCVNDCDVSKPPPRDSMRRMTTWVFLVLTKEIEVGSIPLVLSDKSSSAISLIFCSFSFLYINLFSFNVLLFSCVVIFMAFSVLEEAFVKFTQRTRDVEPMSG